MDSQLGIERGDAIILVPCVCEYSRVLALSLGSLWEGEAKTVSAMHLFTKIQYNKTSVTINFHRIRGF